MNEDYFVRLNSEEKAIFNSYSFPLVFRKNQDIFVAGDLPNYSYFIEKGRVKIYRVTLDGEYVTMSIRHPGEIFGLAEALCDMPRKCFATSLEITSLQVIKKEDLYAILSQMPQLHMKFSQVLSRRLRRAETMIHDLVYYQVKARLARLLLRMADQCGNEFKDYTIIELVLTHKDIASMIGVSRQSVTIALQQLKDSNIIDYQKRKILIMDLQKLNNLT